MPLFLIKPSGMRYLVIIILVYSVTACSCRNRENLSAEQFSKSLSPQSNLNDTATGQLITMLNDYYNLKEALLIADAAVANKTGRQLYTTIDEFLLSLESDSINKPLLLPILTTIKLETNEILKIKDESCERKHIPFQYISDAMFDLLKTAGIKNVAIYRQYCPMVFNDKGASWLSNSAEIRNPYFGKKLLECGEITYKFE
jgi:Cu(I)/Ag(I) efflux system membrane fusion protein